MQPSQESFEPKAIKQKKQDLTNAVLVVLFMVAITIVLGGVSYVWVASMGTGSYKTYSEAYQKELGKQEVPIEPVIIDISSKLNVDYVLIENDLICIYDLYYTSTFKYEETNEPRLVSLPLPKGSLEELKVSLNGVPINRPNVNDNSIKIILESNKSNIVSINYIAFGTEKYSHAIPKNKLLESFNMRLEIDGVDINYQKDLPKSCLTPDNIKTTNEKTILEWNKKSTVLKKDILIELPKKTNPYTNYFYFLPCLIVLVIIFSLFYYESFQRLKLELKNEYFGFLITPILIFYLILGMALIYLQPIYAVPISILGFTGIIFIVQKKMLPIKKGFHDILFFQSFLIISVSSYLFYNISTGLLIGTIFMILTIIIILNFFRKYKRPYHPVDKKNDPFEQYNLISEREDLLIKVKKMQKKIEQLKEIKTIKTAEKRFCIFCRSNVTSSYDFCPKCGKDIRKISKCHRCDALISGNEQFCPNCGSNFKNENA